MDLPHTWSDVVINSGGLVEYTWRAYDGRSLDGETAAMHHMVMIVATSRLPARKAQHYYIIFYIIGTVFLALFRAIMHM